MIHSIRTKRCFLVALLTCCPSVDSFSFSAAGSSLYRQQVGIPFHRNADANTAADNSGEHAFGRRIACFANPSKVSDEDRPSEQPTVDNVSEEIFVTEDADLPITPPEELENEMNYQEDQYPVPGQPWRRGRTDGAEDPIAAPWRAEAEEIIRLSVGRVGALVQGITWYMGKIVITIDPESLERVVPALTGPPVVVVSDHEAQQSRTDFEWQDKPKYQRQLQEDGIENLPVIRQQMVTVEDAETSPVPVDAISSVAQSVLEALNDPEIDERLDITSRHEIIITTPGISNVLETQKEFDAFKGFDVMVKTIDPFKSNRTLQGKLVERNALDVKINVKGRIVTIPNNFVDQVVLPPAKKEKGDRS